MSLSIYVESKKLKHFSEFKILLNINYKRLRVIMFKLIFRSIRLYVFPCNFFLYIELFVAVCTRYILRRQYYRFRWIEVVRIWIVFSIRMKTRSKPRRRRFNTVCASSPGNESGINRSGINMIWTRDNNYVFTRTLRVLDNRKTNRKMKILYDPVELLVYRSAESASSRPTPTTDTEGGTNIAVTSV